jgi:uncharacterized protein YaaN involved in tellurite resistance
MSDDFKRPADQVEEIAKLVQDAQEKLDQVTRALRTLEDRLRLDAADAPAAEP